MHFAVQLCSFISLTIIQDEPHFANFSLCSPVGVRLYRIVALKNARVCCSSLPPMFRDLCSLGGKMGEGVPIH